jgi:hypothetical protein
VAAVMATKEIEPNQHADEKIMPLCFILPTINSPSMHMAVWHRYYLMPISDSGM